MNQILNYVYLVDLEDVQYDYDEAIVSCKVKVINSKGDAKTANISIREQD